MSVPFSGSFKRSGGIVSAIAKQVKLINLKAIKRVNVSFDPFHENVNSTREFLFHLSCPKIAVTNPNCIIKTEVVCDRSSPKIDFILIPSVQSEFKLKNISFDCENLNSLELLRLCNKHISVLAPKEDPVSSVKTKSEKKSAAGKGKVGKRK